MNRGQGNIESGSSPTSFGWVKKLNVFSRRRRRQQSLAQQGHLELHPTEADGGTSSEILGLASPKKRSLFLRHHRGSQHHRSSPLERDRSGTTRASAETETTTTTETTSRLRLDMSSLSGDNSRIFSSQQQSNTTGGISSHAQQQPRRLSKSNLQGMISQQQSNYLQQGHDESQHQTTMKHQQQQQQPQILAPVEEIESKSNSGPSSSNASMSKEMEFASASTSSPVTNADAMTAASANAAETQGMASSSVNTTTEEEEALETPVSSVVSPLSVPIPPASLSDGSNGEASPTLDEGPDQIEQEQGNDDDRFSSMIQILQSTTRSTPHSVKLVVSTMEELLASWTVNIDPVQHGDCKTQTSDILPIGQKTEMAKRNGDAATGILLLVTSITSTMKRYANVGRIQNAGCALLASIMTHQDDDSADESNIIIAVTNSRQLARNIADGLAEALERHGSRYQSIIVHSCHIINLMVGWLVLQKGICHRLITAIVLSLQTTFQLSLRMETVGSSNSNSSSSSSSKNNNSNNTSNSNSPSGDTDSRQQRKRENERQEGSTPPYLLYRIHQDALETIRYLVVGANCNSAVFNRMKILSTFVKVLVRYSSPATDRIPKNACVEILRCTLEAIWGLFPHRIPTVKTATKKAGGGTDGGKDAYLDEWKGGNRPTIIIKDTITAIISVMRRYQHEVIQESACSALSCLAELFYQNFNETKNKNNRQDILSLSQSTNTMESSPLTWLLLETMIKCIAEAMQKYSSLAVQTQACSALWNWTNPSASKPQRPHAVNAVCQSVLKTPELVTTIMATIIRHKSNSSVIKRATGIYLNLVQSHRFQVVGDSSGKKWEETESANTADWSVQTSALLQVLLSPPAFGALFDILHCHAQNESIHQNTCSVLSSLLKYVDGAVNDGKASSLLSRFLLSFFTAERAERYIKTTVSVLQRFSCHSVIATSSCQMLRHLIEIISNINFGGHAGGRQKDIANHIACIMHAVPNLLISVMKSQIENVGFQESACAILLHFALTDELFYHESITSIGGLGVLLLVMRAHMKHPPILVMAASTLECLIIRLDSLGGVISVEDAVVVVLKAMGEMSESKVVQRAGMLALRFWTWHSCYQETIVAADGRERVLAAMEKHIEVPLIQQVGCDILGALSRFEYAEPKLSPSHSSSSSLASSISASSTSACSVDRVIKAMILCIQNHNPEVQVSALEALLQVLLSLSATSANSRLSATEIAVAEKIRAMDGDSVILSILKDDSSGVTLHRAALATLCRLAQSFGTCKDFEQTDVDAVLSCMRQNNNVGTQESGCALLKRLSLENTNVACLITTASEGIDTILHSLESHADNHIVATEACSLLAILLEVQETYDNDVPIIDPSDGVGVIVSVLALYNDSDLILRDSFSVLCRLSIQYSNQESVTVWSPECARAIVSKMAELEKSSYHQELGCRAIYCLLAKNEAEMVSVMSSKGGDSMINAMRKYMENVSLHTYALGALGRLVVALDSIASQEIGIRTIIASMVRYPNIRALQEGGLSAIRFLSWSENNQELIVKLKGVETIVSSITFFSEDSTIQELAFGALDNLATNAESISLIGRAVDCILSGMRTFVTEVSVQEYGCSLLKNLTANELCKSNIIDAGGLDVIASTMRTFSKNSSVQKEACSALYRLTRGSSSYVSPELICQIITTMKIHASSCALQVNCCGVLRNICINKDNCKSTFKVGGVEALLSSVRKHQESSSLQELAFRALLYMSFEETNQSAILASGGLDTLILIMRLHRGNGPLQEIGMDMMANLAPVARTSTASEQVETIVGGMRYHIDVPIIQERGCDALVSVARGLAPGEREKTEESTLETILSALKAHTQNSSVCESSFQALRYYALSETNQFYVLTTGSVGTILSIMERHHTDSLQAEGCSVLSHLASSHKTKVAIAADGMRVILSALEKHKIAAVQEAGCEALCSLAEEVSNRVLIAGAGGIDTLLRSMRLFQANLSIQIHCLGALAYLSLNHTNKLSIAAAHGINSIVASMRFHSASFSLQRHACQALSNLSTNSTIKLIMVAAGVIETIMATMNKFSKKDAIQKSCCEALNHLAWNTENRENVAGRVDVILKAMDEHATSSDVQLQCCTLLSNLASNGSNHPFLTSPAIMGGLLSAMANAIDDSRIQEVASEALLKFNLASASNLWGSGESGVGTLLQSMRRNIGHESIQASCLGILGNLASQDVNKDSMVSAGAIEVVVLAMQNFSASLIQERACACLRHLAYQNRNHKFAIYSAGGVENILDAMEGHIECPAVEDEACGALWSLSFLPPNREKIVSLDGVGKLVLTMRKFPDHASIQGRGCGLLSNLSLDFPDAVAALGGIKDIFEAMRNHVIDDRVQEEACTALARVANNPTCRRTIAAIPGAIELIMAARKHHGSIVATHAGFILWNLSFNNKCRPEMIRVGAMDIVDDLMDEHGEEIPEYLTMYQNNPVEP